MSRLVLIPAVALLAAMVLAPAVAPAARVSTGAGGAAVSAKRFTLVVAGGQEDNEISIVLSEDGGTYTIQSNGPLETGTTVTACVNPPGDPNTLVCQAGAISGFEVNAWSGNDRVMVGKTVATPVTLRGGPGHDTLVAGAGSDKLIGGAGRDILHGRAGDDALYGGPGADRLFGGPGDDRLRGGPGRDRLAGGSGRDDLQQESRKARVRAGSHR